MKTFILLNMFNILKLELDFCQNKKLFRNEAKMNQDKSYLVILKMSLYCCIKSISPRQTCHHKLMYCFEEKQNCLVRNVHLADGYCIAYHADKNFSQSNFSRFLDMF